MSTQGAALGLVCEALPGFLLISAFFLSSAPLSPNYNTFRFKEALRVLKAQNILSPGQRTGFLHIL